MPSGPRELPPLFVLVLAEDPTANKCLCRCGACVRTAKFKLKNPDNVTCKYPKRKEGRRLVVKTEETSDSDHAREHSRGLRSLPSILSGADVGDLSSDS